MSVRLGNQLLEEAGRPLGAKSFQLENLQLGPLRVLPCPGQPASSECSMKSGHGLLASIWGLQAIPECPMGSAEASVTTDPLSHPACSSAFQQLIPITFLHANPHRRQFLRELSPRLRWTLAWQLWRWARKRG